MAVTLREADAYLKNLYLDVVNDILKNNKKSAIKSTTVRCRECGRSGVTLRKCPDGFYICEDCLNKGEEIDV